MGTITVNVNDETEKRFRKRVSQMYGNGKGKLGKALTEAMDSWEKRYHFEILNRLLDKKVKRGGINYKKREELYDRS